MSYFNDNDFDVFKSCNILMNQILDRLERLLKINF